MIGEAKALEKLSISGKNLKSAAFVEKLPELVELGLGGPKLDLAPVAKLKKMRQLYAERTGVADITALKGLTSLRELYIGFNEITSLEALRGLTSLATLRISENPVKSLAPIADLPLTHLEVGTGTIEKSDAACPVDADTNALVRKFCLRFRKIGKK